MKYGLSEDTIQKIQAVLTTFPQIEKAVIFGSRVKGNYKKGSDIDLTLHGAELTPKLLHKIEDELDDLLLPYKIDLSVFDLISDPDFMDHILRVGQVFYEKKSQKPEPVETGWKEKRLAEITTKIGSGATPLGGETAYKAEGISLIRSLNVHDIGFRMKDLAFLDDTQADKLSNVIVESGDVLLNITGASVARCCIVPDNVLPARVNQHVSIIRLLKDEMLPEFLHYALISNEYKNKLLQTGEKGGSTRQAITKAQIEYFSVEYPPIPEQQRIVAVLDEAFASIAQAKANAERNLVNARELFESVLQDIFENKSSDWNEKTLQDVVDANCTLSYGIVQPGEEYPNGLPIIRPTDLTKKVITLAGLKRIDPRLADSYKRTTLTGNELLLCVRGSTGVVSITTKELNGANVTRGIVPIRFKSEAINQEFGYYLLVSDHVQKQIKEKTYGTALMQINIGDLREILVLFPPLAEQHTIVKRLDALSVETKRLEEIYKQKLAALDELKKSILQKAFAGEL